MGADRDPRYKTMRWQRTAKRVIARDQRTCQLKLDGCTIDASQADHIVSPLLGGSFWDESNLQGACRHCNAVDGARLGHRLRKLNKYEPSRDW